MGATIENLAFELICLFFTHVADTDILRFAFTNKRHYTAAAHELVRRAEDEDSWAHAFRILGWGYAATGTMTMFIKKTGIMARDTGLKNGTASNILALLDKRFRSQEPSEEAELRAIAELVEALLFDQACKEDPSFEETNDIFKILTYLPKKERDMVNYAEIIVKFLNGIGSFENFWHYEDMRWLLHTLLHLSCSVEITTEILQSVFPSSCGCVRQAICTGQFFDNALNITEALGRLYQAKSNFPIAQKILQDVDEGISIDEMWRVLKVCNKLQRYVKITNLLPGLATKSTHLIVQAFQNDDPYIAGRVYDELQSLEVSKLELDNIGTKITAEAQTNIAYQLDAQNFWEIKKIIWDCSRLLHISLALPCGICSDQCIQLGVNKPAFCISIIVLNKYLSETKSLSNFEYEYSTMDHRKQGIVNVKEAYPEDWFMQEKGCWREGPADMRHMRYCEWINMHKHLLQMLESHIHKVLKLDFFDTPALVALWSYLPADLCENGESVEVQKTHLHRYLDSTTIEDRKKIDRHLNELVFASVQRNEKSFPYATMPEVPLKHLKVVQRTLFKRLLLQSPWVLWPILLIRYDPAKFEEMAGLLVRKTDDERGVEIECSNHSGGYEGLYLWELTLSPDAIPLDEKAVKNGSRRLIKTQEQTT